MWERDKIVPRGERRERFGPENNKKKKLNEGWMKNGGEGRGKKKRKKKKERNG